MLNISDFMKIINFSQTFIKIINTEDILMQQVSN